MLATGIENIIGGQGVNIFRFHGDARLDGVVGSHAAGKVILDYSDYTSSPSQIGGVTYDGAIVDGSAGTTWGIPAIPFPIPGLGTFPGVGFENGRASGVLGSRLAGLDLIISRRSRLTYTGQ